jgi:hypothetical protein
MSLEKPFAPANGNGQSYWSEIGLGLLPAFNETRPAHASQNSGRPPLGEVNCDGKSDDGRAGSGLRLLLGDFWGGFILVKGSSPWGKACNLCTPMSGFSTTRCHLKCAYPVQLCSFLPIPLVLIHILAIHTNIARPNLKGEIALGTV